MLTAFAVAAMLACVRLPPNWENATRVQTFTQSACTGDIGELEQRHGARMKVTPDGDRVRIDYFNAHFRCGQPVAAYAKSSDRTLDVLVQPVDMHPSSVAKCDCLYDIHLEVPGLAAGTWNVILHRRWDDRQLPNEPVQVGSDRAVVR